MLHPIQVDYPDWCAPDWADMNWEGVIELDVPGAVSIRSEIEHTLKDRATWEEHYKPRLQWSENRVADA